MIKDDESASLYPSSFILHPFYDSPLPWDHLNTGIDKQWLKDDLQRALVAATVPDCSFDGCSHCGVCGTDLGHNVVVPPLPIPDFAGHFQPNQNRVQRLRIWLGKQGDMALVSHLDLVRLFDRAIRRAAIPIAFTGGFHPSPRIIPANALSLGATSSGEIVDFELTAALDPTEFQDRLAAQFPADLPIYRVEEVPLTAPAATQLLERAEYQLLVGIAEDNNAGDRPQTVPTEAEWQHWINRLLEQSEIWAEHTTKSGKKQPVNLRDRLFALSLEPSSSPAAPVHLRYIGSCRNDGTLLRPEQLIFMLEHIAHCPIQLLKIHRTKLILQDQIEGKGEKDEVGNRKDEG